MDIPAGIFVFTSDRREVGTATAVDDREITVGLRGVDATVTIPLSATDRIESGRLLLTLDTAELRSQYLSGMSAEAREWGAPGGDVAGDDHVSREAVDFLWPNLHEKSWKGLLDTALKADEDSAGDIPPATMSDVILVGRHLDGSGEPFPESAAELCATLNRHAAVLPHETSGS